MSMGRCRVHVDGLMGRCGIHIDEEVLGSCRWGGVGFMLMGSY